MKRHSFVRGLLTATTLATGLLLVGSTSASAENAEHAPAQFVAGSTDTTVLPPVFSNVRVLCFDEEAGVTAKLRNPNATVQEYMVGITVGDVHYDYVVMVAARGAEPVEFGGLPNGAYLLQAQNAVGDFVAEARGRVQCEATPPTGTPTGTPTRTPTAPPSQTPTAPPSQTPTAPPSQTPTSVPPTTTAPTSTASSTPVAVPTAVDAGLPGAVVQDDSNHSWTIAGAGLLAAGGIVIVLALLLVRRRRGPHQL